MLKKGVLFLLLCSGMQCVIAHEFWIEPLDYSVSSDKQILAMLKSGEHFKGKVYPYMPERIVKVFRDNSTGRTTIDGNAGGFPAIKIPAIHPGGQQNGLHVISYQSTPSELKHNNFEGFLNFLNEDGLQWVEAEHKQRGLPREQFTEQFTRYAKSLVAVGDGAGSDKVAGLPYEMVALNNPYDIDVASITVQLLDHGTPVAGHQVTIFQRPRGQLDDKEPVKLFTNEQGQVIVPRGEGGQFLVSSVVMKEGDNAPWHSHWASITYEVQ